MLSLLIKNETSFTLVIRNCCHGDTFITLRRHQHPIATQILATTTSRWSTANDTDNPKAESLISVLNNHVTRLTSFTSRITHHTVHTAPPASDSPPIPNNQCKQSRTTRTRHAPLNSTAPSFGPLCLSCSKATTIGASFQSASAWHADSKTPCRGGDQWVVVTRGTGCERWELRCMGLVGCVFGARVWRCCGCGYVR
jgi:hypothetical protein